MLYLYRRYTHRVHTHQYIHNWVLYRTLALVWACVVGVCPFVPYYIIYIIIDVYTYIVLQYNPKKKIPAYKIYYLVRVIIQVVFINFPFAASSSLGRCR